MLLLYFFLCLFIAFVLKDVVVVHDNDNNSTVVVVNVNIVVVEAESVEFKSEILLCNNCEKEVLRRLIIEFLLQYSHLLDLRVSRVVSDGFS